MKKTLLTLLAALTMASCGGPAEDIGPTEVTKTEGALLPNCNASLPGFNHSFCPGTQARSLCWYNIGFNVPVVGCRYAYGTVVFPYFAWSDCVSSC